MRIHGFLENGAGLGERPTSECPSDTPPMSLPRQGPERVSGPPRSPRYDVVTHLPTTLRCLLEFLTCQWAPGHRTLCFSAGQVQGYMLYPNLTLLDCPDLSSRKSVLLTLANSPCQIKGPRALRVFVFEEFLMWTVFKVFIECDALFNVCWCFGQEACGILASRPEI